MTPDNFQSVVIRNLIEDSNYTRTVIPFIKQEYFDIDHRVIFKLIAQYVKKYNKIPTTSAIQLYFNNQTDITQHYTEEQHELFNRIITNKNDYDTEWLVDQTEEWCKERAIYLAVMESISILDNPKKKDNRKSIPELLRKGLAVTFDTDIGHDYINDAEKRWKFYNSKETKIPFDIDLLNQITGGGLPRKTLNVVMSMTGGGKTLFMCHCAAANLIAQKKVLYITLEMAEERIAERIDSNLTNIPIGDVYTTSKDDYNERIKEVSRKIRGSQLIIKEFPTGCANSEHFRMLLDELKIKKEFIPDIIYLDYLNIAAPSSISTKSSGSYAVVKAISEETRSIAVDYNVPIVTATQTNRDGYNNSDADLENVSEGYSISSTSDLILSLISNEELAELDQIMVKQLKNRYNDPFKNHKFTIGIDRSRMKLYNLATVNQPPLY